MSTKAIYSAVLVMVITKYFAECPVACRGDECMPCTEGYKGGVKSPLSA
jgi:hypothetical protein